MMELFPLENSCNCTLKEIALYTTDENGLTLSHQKWCLLQVSITSSALLELANNSKKFKV